MAKIDMNEVSEWNKATFSQRNNLDLATIFWLWNKVVDDFDVEVTINSIFDFFDERDITHISPRILWGELLGESSMVNARQKIIRQSNGMLKIGKLGHIEEPIPENPSTHGSNNTLFNLTQNCKVTYRLLEEYDASDSNTFNMDRWEEILRISLRTRKQSEDYDLVWFLRYRHHLHNITPFSDYYLVERSSTIINYANSGETYDDNDFFDDEYAEDYKDIDYRLIFFEQLITEKEADIYRIRLATSGDKFTTVEGMTPNGRDYFINHQILGNPRFTHSFIDLDLLIEKADEADFSIPTELRKPKDCDTHIGHGEVQHITDIKIDFESYEQFPLLKLAPIIIDYLNNDPVGIELMSNGTSNEKIIDALHNSINRSQSTLEFSNNEIKNIWQIIVHPDLIRQPNRKKKTLQKVLKEVRIEYWQGKEPIVHLKNSDKLERFKKDGHGTTDALAFIALLSPEAKKGSGKVDKQKLEEYCNQIMAINLDWTEQKILKFVANNR